MPLEGTLPSRDGEVDPFGHVRLSGIGNLLESEIANAPNRNPVPRFSVTTNAVVPDAVDRVLTTRFRFYAIDALHNGHFGQMVALHGTTIELVPLVEAMAAVKLVPPELYAETEIFFG